MNYSVIFYLLGWILTIASMLMTLPLATAMVYREPSGLAFAATMAIGFFVGFVMVREKPKNKMFHAKEGYVTVALSWIILSIFGAVPFVISGYIPDPINALFETVSGFTTTGASILDDIEALSHCMLMWRSFTHWIGGMGVLVFLLCLLPLTGASNMNLMKAESPGPSVGRLVPKVKSTAVILYKIYFVMTLTMIGLLLLGRMPMFDAICTAFGTAGTGGFGIRGDSIGGYNTYIQVVTTVFMILFGVNFNVYFLLTIKKIKPALLIEEIRYYFLVIAVSILLITLNVRHMFPSLSRTIQQVSFQVGSIITTTGFSTTDFNLWPSFSQSILVLLMFCGACAGSTGGGIKVSRFLILAKTMKKEVQIYLHPNLVKKVKMDGKLIPHEVVRATNIFLVAYLLIFSVSVLIVSLDNFDFTTNFTAVAATFNNIGPGLSMVGPAENFNLFSPLSKCVLIVDMLAGRLEIFPILMLCVPKTWKKF